MKINGPRRRVFNDAIDLLTDDASAESSGNDSQEIPIKDIKPFHNHPFRLYEGERLNDMIESIKEHGILTPVIVLKTEDGYEMLAGHNRWNAAMQAGLTEIPAIIKEGLTDEEAYVYVIETNLMQRSFTDMLPSEKAAALAERYEKVLSQGKRNDILRELEILEGIEPTCGNGCHTLSRDSIGEEYGLCGRSVANLLRINELIPGLKDWTDTGFLNFMAAVQLSYVSEEIQNAVYSLGRPVNKETAAKLRKEGITVSDVEDIVSGVKAHEKKRRQSKSVRISRSLYEKYFKDSDAGMVEDIVEKALDAWFKKKETE